MILKMKRSSFIPTYNDKQQGRSQQHFRDGRNGFFTPAKFVYVVSLSLTRLLQEHATSTATNDRNWIGG